MGVIWMGASWRNSSIGAFQGASQENSVTSWEHVPPTFSFGRDIFSDFIFDEFSFYDKKHGVGVASFGPVFGCHFGFILTPLRRSERS